MPAQSMTHRIPSRRNRNEKGGIFQVLQSVHFGDGPPGCDCDACYDSGSKNHVYEAAFNANGHRTKPEDYIGDIIDSPKQDLVERFGTAKFKRLHPHELPPAYVEAQNARKAQAPTATEPVNPEPQKQKTGK